MGTYLSMASGITKIMTGKEIKGYNEKSGN